MTEQVTTGRNRSRLAGGGHLPAKVTGQDQTKLPGRT